MPSSRSRRDVLGLGGTALALLTGCLGSSREYGSAETTTTTTTTEAPETRETTAATTPPPNVEITDVTVLPELVAFDTPDSTSTIGKRDEQFVVVEIASWDEVDPSFQDFTLATNDETYQLDQWGRRTNQGDSLWPLYGDMFETAGAGYVVFRLPKPLESKSATLNWPGGAHQLDSEDSTKLARPPTDFVVREFAAPERIENAEQISLKLVVENTGTVDGTFIGSLDRAGPQVAYTPEETIVLDVPATETASWTYTFRPPILTGDEGGSVHFELDWRGEQKRTKTEIQTASS